MAIFAKIEISIIQKSSETMLTKTGFGEFASVLKLSEFGEIRISSVTLFLTCRRLRLFFLLGIQSDRYLCRFDS
jgi:hypothetical protein